MSDKRTLLVGLCLAALAGCATTQKTTLLRVGSSSHAPYPAKPEYLGTRALPDPSLLQRGPVAARIHLSAPAVDTSGDDSDPGVAESAEPAPDATPEPAPQRGGSLTVAPSNEAPLPNRLPDVPQPWPPPMPTDTPQDHP